MIYREKLIELLDHATQTFRFDAWENTDKIADHLIANGVEIPVHCKDCKHCKEYRNRLDPMYNHFMCVRRDSYIECVDEDDFCSYGEREDNG